MVAESTESFWEAHGLLHITPRGIVWPEGFDVRGMLGSIYGTQRVVEVGCGIGRLCKAFPPNRYIGYDICSAALIEARNEFPDYVFTDVLPDVTDSMVLAYTVFLHMPDAQLKTLLRALSHAKRIVIGEMLGHEWRRKGVPPVFNREMGEYCALLRDVHFDVVRVRCFPYRYYHDRPFTLMEFEHC